MTGDLVLRSDAGQVATLTLNRPQKLNALDDACFRALRAHLDALMTDEGVRCVVVTGAGRSFCAGHDLDAIAAGEDDASLRFAAETIDLLERLPQPTIASIRGHCFTGGLELALACDLLVAAADAQLADTHGQWGLTPVWGLSVRLPERIGRSPAKELMFTSRRISGADAAELGLVDRSVHPALLDRAVAELAGQIAANSPWSNRIAKAMLAAHAGMARREALEFERSEPFGRPADMDARLAAGGR
jgi:enoyl-CoA hydratase